MIGERSSSSILRKTIFESQTGNKLATFGWPVRQVAHVSNLHLSSPSESWGPFTQARVDFQPGSAHHPWFFFFLVYMNPGWALFKTCFSNPDQLCTTRVNPSHSDRRRKHVVFFGLFNSCHLFDSLATDLIVIRLSMQENIAIKSEKKSPFLSSISDL